MCFWFNCIRTIQFRLEFRKNIRSLSLFHLVNQFYVLLFVVQKFGSHVTNLITVCNTCCLLWSSSEKCYIVFKIGKNKSGRRGRWFKQEKYQCKSTNILSLNLPCSRWSLWNMHWFQGFLVWPTLFFPRGGISLQTTQVKSTSTQCQQNTSN